MCYSIAVMKKRFLYVLLSLLLLAGSVSATENEAAPKEPSASAEKSSLMNESKADDKADAGGDFRILLLNDTQHYGKRRFPMLQSIVDFALKEAERDEDLLLCIHTGDVLASGYDDESAAELARLTEAMPYLLCAGNHDVDSSGSRSAYRKFVKLFPHLAEFSEENLRDEGRCLSYTFTKNGVNFIVIGTGWIVRNSDVEWINEKLAAHPDHYAILFTHSYLRTSEGRTDTGDRLYKKVVLQNPNVHLILCGHKHDCRVETVKIDDDGDGSMDRSLHQMISNYQDVGDGGDGYLRFLDFDLEKGQIAVSTYSPYLDDYDAFEDGIDSFVLATDFSFARAE